MSDHIGDTNKMVSDTPRTDRNYIGMQLVPASFAQQLERDLNVADSIIRQQQLLDEENLRLRQRIKRLEEAGNNMYAFINPPSASMRTTRMDNLLQGWDDAKIGREAKP